jgi:hypothetical protein
MDKDENHNCSDFKTFVEDDDASDGGSMLDADISESE